MLNGIMNKLIINLAINLKIAPGIAHIIILFIVSLGYLFVSPDGLKDFKDPFFIKMWFGICSLIVFVTWLTKGKYRKMWWLAKPWQSSNLNKN